MLGQVSLATNILKSPKPLDCMYGTRNVRLSHETKRDCFSNLLSTMAQTNNLNTYIEPKPLWQDTHEVSQGLEHVTFGELDTYVNVSWHICICVNKTLPCFPTKPCIQFENQIHGKARLFLRNKPMNFGFNLITFEKMWHIRVCVNLEVFKMLQDFTHT